MRGQGASATGEGTMTVRNAGRRRTSARYWALIFVAFLAAFVVGVPVSYLSVWLLGGRMGEIEGAGKYVAIII